MLHVIDNFLSSSECSTLLNRLSEKVTWDPAMVGKPSLGEYPTSKKESKIRHAYAAGKEIFPTPVELLEKKILRLIQPTEIGFSRTERLDLSGSQFVKYPVGGFYKVHSDANYASKRVCTVLIYFNDNFSGGETTFPGCEVEIKPSTGKAVVFPSTFLHKACPTTSGSKTIFVTWYCREHYSDWI